MQLSKTLPFDSTLIYPAQLGTFLYYQVKICPHRYRMTVTPPHGMTHVATVKVALSNVFDTKGQEGAVSPTSKVLLVSVKVC